MKIEAKNTIVNVFSLIFGLILLAAAYNRIVNAEIYVAMVPKFISVLFADIFAVGAEAFVGLLLIIPKTRKYGALGFTFLMIIFFAPSYLVCFPG